MRFSCSFPGTCQKTSEGNVMSSEPYVTEVFHLADCVISVVPFSTGAREFEALITGTDSTYSMISSISSTQQHYFASHSLNGQ